MDKKQGEGQLFRLQPGTLFMGDKITNFDEELFVVSDKYDEDDPFVVLVEYEDAERIYWIGGSESMKPKTYSCFKSDVVLF